MEHGHLADLMYGSGNTKAAAQPAEPPAGKGEVGSRTDEQLARSIYGQSEHVEPLEDHSDDGPLKPRSDQDLAALLYGEPSERFASRTEGRSMTLIRKLSGAKAFEADYQGDTRALVAANANQLGEADLREVRLADMQLDHGNVDRASIQGADASGISLTWASCRGLDARGASLRGARFNFGDLTGVRVDQTTDISRADFTGATMTDADYRSLLGCRESASAKGLQPRRA